MTLKKSETFNNLIKAYAGECQAHVRYQFISYGAKQAELFELQKAVDTIVLNEYNHARMYYSEIQKADKQTLDNLEVCAGYPFKEKWNLEDNLKFAAEDETAEHEKIYPEYAKVARKEGFEEIAKLFDLVACVEECHKKQLTQLHEQLTKGTMYKRTKAIKWKCACCGHEATAKQAWEICPLCKAPQGNVMLNLEDN